MSTRSFIILKVRKEDIGKGISFNPNKLPVELKGWGLEADEEKSQPVVINKPYIGIYCHWDGYPKGGVGDALKEKFNDYDSILNLIAGGSCSSICEEYVCHYADRKGEEWDYIKPWQGDNKDEQPDSWQEYAYLFEEGKGWKYRYMYAKTKAYRKL